jgi:hypothetical protein
MNRRDEPPPLLAYIALARSTDPRTSHAAAESLSGETLARLEQLVCDILAAHPEGLTTSEVARLCSLGRDSISPRMKRLEKVKRVVRTGETRIPAGKRKPAQIWWLVA